MPRPSAVAARRKLLKARSARVRQQYRFDEILLSKNPAKFQELVPVHDYNKIYQHWWKKTLEGIPDVLRFGVKYYALSMVKQVLASTYR